MNKTIIFDTDIISTFAKIDKLDLLENIFPKDNLKITSEIYEELSVPLDYGYNFPKKIYDKLEILPLNKKEQKLYQNLILENETLDKGELEAITACIERKHLVFSSLDDQALKFAREKGVDTLSLHSILRIGFKNSIIDKENVKEIIEEIEEKDNTTVKNISLIFE